MTKNEEKDKRTDRHTHTQSRQTDWQTHTQTHRTDRQIDKETDNTGSSGCPGTHTHTHTHTQTHRTDRQKNRHTHKQTEQIDKQTDTHTQTDWQTHTHKHTEQTDRLTESQTIPVLLVVQGYSASTFVRISTSWRGSTSGTSKTSASPSSTKVRTELSTFLRQSIDGRRSPDVGRSTNSTNSISCPTSGSPSRPRSSPRVENATF